MPALQPTQITLGTATVSSPGVPWWGYQDLKLLGGVLGFQNPPSRWDVVLVGPNQIPLPGLVKVRSCRRRMKLHRKEHPASDFETQTFQGYSVVEFDFDLVMWTRQQLAALQAALAYCFPGSGDPAAPQALTSISTVSSTTNLVDPASGLSYGNQPTQQVQASSKAKTRPPLPVQVTHPALQIHGVDAVIFEYMDGPVQRSESVPDIFVVHFKTVQFKPARPVKSDTPKNPGRTLQTPLGQTPDIPFIDTTADLVPTAEQLLAPPSASGGANPPGAAQSASFLPPGGP